MGLSAAAGPEQALEAAALALGLRLKALGQMAVTVESCTGGMIARALTEIAGSSVWFDRGFVTYSNHSKIELVGVSAATLAEHGAVSEPTAAEMAAGGLARSAAALAISVTGIAGPGGAVPGKPVGTVCFGWALSRALQRELGRPALQTACLHFDGDRAAVRFGAAIHALDQALLLLAVDPKD